MGGIDLLIQSLARKRISIFPIMLNYPLAHSWSCLSVGRSMFARCFCQSFRRPVLFCQVCLLCLFIAAPLWDVLDKFLWGAGWDTYRQAPGLTRTHTRLWHLFFAQKETRCCRYSVARLQWSTGHSDLGGGGVYYITANGTKSNLSLPFWERKHSVSQSVINFLNSVSYELGRFVCEPRLRDTAINL